MGWAPETAMRADPVLIELAWRGWCDQREELERMLYGAAFGAQGLPNPVQPKVSRRHKGRMLAERWKAFASAHNAQFAAKSKPSRAPAR